MEKQSVVEAFATFFKDLPKAAVVCHASMIGSIGIIVLVGNKFANYVATNGNINLQTAGFAIAAELILIWPVAFAFAVKTRPTRAEEFCQYPPISMLGGALRVSLFLGVALGILSGIKMGFRPSQSFFYVLPGIFTIPFLMIFIFVPTAPATQAVIKMKRDPTLAIADSFRNTWLFSALALLVIGLLLRWAAGEQPELTPYSVTMNTALITAVSYTGYASGYYP